MKKIRNIIFSALAFLFFSCNQLNLRNPAGSLMVSLPGSSSRMILPDGNVSDLEAIYEISYEVFLYSSSGKLVESKPAFGESAVVFPEIPEGSYVVKAVCYASGDGVASGFVSVDVKGGETAFVPLEMLYNRPERLDEKSYIKYSGKTEFEDENSLRGYFNDGIFKNNLSAELMFTNGWKESQRENLEVGDLIKKNDVPANPDIPVSSSNSSEYNVYVRHEGSGLETTITLKVVPKQIVLEPDPEPQDPVIIEGTGLSEDMPCTSMAELLYALNSVDSDGTVYLGGSGNVFLLNDDGTDNGSIEVKKNVTLESVASGDLLIQRSKSNVTFVISSGVTLTISNSKKIKFTDTYDISTVASYEPLFQGSNGSLVANGAEFSAVGGPVGFVRTMKFENCNFNGNKSNYGAIHVISGYSAEVISCSFTGNASKQDSIGNNYADIYLVKGSEDEGVDKPLSLGGTVSSDIGIYVANNADHPNPDIDVSGITFASGKKLRVKVDMFPSGPSAVISVFKKPPENMNKNMTFALKGKDDEYSLKDYFTDLDSFTYDDVYYSMNQSDEFTVHVN